MTKEEITSKIESLRSRKFYLWMKDHWDRKDFELSDKWTREICELKKALEEME